MKNQENRENKNKICMITLSLLGSAIFILIFFMMFGDFFTQVSYAKEVDSKEMIQTKTYFSSMELPIDLFDVIEQNMQDVVTEQLEREERDLEYTTRYTQNSSLPKGTIQVLQDGIDGKQNIVIKKSYKNSELIEEKIVGSQIVKSSVDKLVQIGTGNGMKQYQVKKGDMLYVTSMILPIRIEADINAEKITTINQGEQVVVQEIKGEWYKIGYKTYSGYAKADCLTYLNQNQGKEDNQITGNSQYTKEQLLNTLGFDMKLNKPSGLSLEQFKKVFQGNSNDKNSIFQDNAEYFYYIEKQYQVNGIFVASVGIHESNWGTSKMAQNKRNLFGYGAYDRNPSDNAYSFNTYAEGIDLLGRVFTKYYLNPKGTSIYGGETATGSYYHGATLYGVNTKYASDKNWANSVYTWMKYLYQKL